MIKDIIIRSGGVSPAPDLPALFRGSQPAWRRFLEFFSAGIRNPHTRRAYLRSALQFAAWCERMGLTEIGAVEPVHVATYIEHLQQKLSRPSVKQHLAALRSLFDWLVVGQIAAANPAAPVRGPKHSARRGKTPVLTAEEIRRLLDSLEGGRAIDVRDRALIGLMSYTFARVGAVVAMNVEDVFVQGGRRWVRLHEKGGKRHDLPCHPELASMLDAWIARLGPHPPARTPLFQSFRGVPPAPTGRRLNQPAVFMLIRRRAEAAGIGTRIGCHSFRATGITTYLKNGGRLEIAQHMANHESPRTTSLYDRRSDEVTLSEVERIRF